MFVTALNNNKAMANALSGSSSLVFCTIFTHPLDTIRVRYAIEFENMRHGSYRSLFSDIMRKEGIISFYRGIVPTLYGCVARGGIGFGIYETLKSDKMREWNEKHAIFKRFSIGMIASLSSTTVSYPLDTVRRRVQVWGGHKSPFTNAEIRIYGEHRAETNAVQHINQSNFFKLVKHIIQTDGFIAFYRGFSLTLIKSPLATAISLTVNDVVKKYIFGVNY